MSTTTYEMEAKLVKKLEYLERELKKRIEVKDRKYMLKTYKRCFIASDVVDYMVGTGQALSRQEAVEMGKILQLQRHFMTHVTEDHHFTDDKLFFRFLTDKERKEKGFDKDKGKREKKKKDAEAKKSSRSKKNVTEGGEESKDKAGKIIKFNCEVTILAGRNLAPKDRILGMGGSSDPYVEVWANDDDELYGTTPVLYKTLNPVWETDNTFKIQMEEAYHLPPPKLELKIWDEDFGSDPDAMGTITLIVPGRNDDTTEWYSVPPHSAKNAKGDLQVRLVTSRCRESRGSGDHRRRKKGGKRTKNKSSQGPRTKSDGIFGLGIIDTTQQSGGVFGLGMIDNLKNGLPAKASSTSRIDDQRGNDNDHDDDDEEQNRSRTPSPERPPSPPPLPPRKRRSMNDTLELPELKVRNCDEIMNECSYWDERVEELGWEIEDLEDRISKTKVFQKAPTNVPMNSRNSILPIVEHLQQEVQERSLQKDKRLQEKFMNSIDKIRLKITIIQGIGLVAKDQDGWGRWVSSDPYVEVWKDRKNLGKTRTAEQTLDPVWNEQFIFVVNRRCPPKIALRLWDEDYDEDEPDCLGTVTIKTPTEEMEITEWHEIPRGTNADKDATGFLQVCVESDLVVDKKAHAEELQKRVDELEQNLKQALMVSQEKTKKGQNELEPTMQFLLEKNKELLKETMALEEGASIP